MLVVDSSVLIEHLRGNPRATRYLDRRRTAGPVLVPALVAWELWKGATTPLRKDAVSSLLAELAVDSFTAAVAQLAGELHLEQQRLGRTRPVFDLLIASHALHHRCDVATVDRDYDGIAGLSVETIS